MLSVRQAASELGVSQARVRALLAKGQIKGEKLGRVWAVDGESLASWKAQRHRAGRPPVARSDTYVQTLPSVEEAHRLYQACRSLLAGCYSSDFLDGAQSQEEELFWVSVSDFFLARRQEELVKEGAY